jgi:hypothetical protein
VIVLHCGVLRRHCPILDVMLRGAERGMGMCTDVALYAMYAGARIIPMPKGERVHVVCMFVCV